MKKYKFLFLLLFSAYFLSGCFLSGKDPQKDGNDKEKSITPEVVQVVLNAPDDSVIFEKFFHDIDSDKLKSEELSDIIIKVALYFEETPYVANTLDISDEEKLVINFREFDCTTFVENVLGLSFMIKNGDSSISDFIEYLRSLRYRDEVISGYPSRLHYFTDWLYHNERKGIVEIVSNDLGNKDFDASVYFMSENPEKYPVLSRNPVFVKDMSAIENEISGYDFKYVSSDYISEITDSVKNGDIIAFTTNIGGLDVAHLGFAYFTNAELHFIHASTNGNRVRISEQTMEEYVSGKSHINGVLIARPKEDYSLSKN
ncbi:N-acetylmuramoyl-L-alanine amidase-like domain-containing protein [Marinilabilia sp.]|uniref:N-acetylmuramoyl-L-alanine amidase-like domain-containing protein n=1 Tax=Marinilabilia sp. TaxID=2021252 RepID=UPI0025BF835A|nr:N-acetylmuramoyl-L-alanine amidase-like domain-containing protein [Marinilabilia sp.]